MSFALLCSISFKVADRNSIGAGITLKCSKNVWNLVAKYFSQRLTSTSCSHGNSLFCSNDLRSKCHILVVFSTNQRFAEGFGMLFAKKRRDWIRWDSVDLTNGFVRWLFELIWYFCIVYVIYVNSLLKARYFNVSTALKLNLFFLWFTSNGPHGVDSIVQKTSMLLLLLLSASYSRRYTQINSTHFSYPQNVYDCVREPTAKAAFTRHSIHGIDVASTTQMKRKRYTLCIA